MMTIDRVYIATLEELTDELAAAGWDSCETSIDEARRSVARLINSVQVCWVYDSETANCLRKATDDEAVESATAGAEGHILVDGRRCYVA